MVKKIVIIFLITSIPSIGWANYKLRLKDGVILTWREFTIEGDQYCTLKEIGKFCLSKKDVVSVKEMPGSDDDAEMNGINYSTAKKTTSWENTRPPDTTIKLATMNQSEFLADYENSERRALLWKLFQMAEQQAKGFVQSSDRWVALRRVVAKKQRAMWIDDGTIEIDPDLDPGTLFHEIFHTAFHKSLLRSGKDEAWGEAFCEAFRYMMEKQLPPQNRSDWFLKINKYTGMSYEQIMSSTADRGHDQKYGFPASLIINTAGKDPEDFKKLWFMLLQKRKESGVDILNNYFYYDMQIGSPLQ